MHSQEPIDISHYVYPEFQQGVVLLKSGESYNAKLNYNIATEEMLFDDKGTILAIGGETLAKIDTVTISNDKFIRMNNKFVKLLVNEPGIDLFVEYKCRILPPSNPVGFGGTSQLTTSTSYSSILLDGRMYSLKLPDDYEIIPSNIYWINRSGESKSFTSIGQLKRIYRDKRRLINDYLKENEVKLDNVKSIKDAIIYMENN